MAQPYPPQGPPRGFSQSAPRVRVLPRFSLLPVSVITETPSPALPALLLGNYLAFQLRKPGESLFQAVGDQAGDLWAGASPGSRVWPPPLPLPAEEVEGPQQVRRGLPTTLLRPRGHAGVPLPQWAPAPLCTAPSSRPPTLQTPVPPPRPPRPQTRGHPSHRPGYWKVSFRISMNAAGEKESVPCLLPEASTAPFPSPGVAARGSRAPESAPSEADARARAPVSSASGPRHVQSHSAVQ